MRFTLPPRGGGAMAMLEGAPGVDVLMVAHLGLESFVSIPNIVRNAPLRVPVKIHCWRVKSSDIPPDPAAQFDWLFHEFEKIDRWICAALEPQREAA